MTVFYRKYRPQKFAEIVGQKNVVATLLGQLASGKISHGYLFCGPKGTGKTSTARIFAKAVNCLTYGKDRTKRQKLGFGEPCNKCVSCLAVVDGSHLDLIEIDAASNRNIDDVRDLREKIKLSPVSTRFKVYIIDEVHMLTKEAFNALLKTLEEPPSHAIFILCTTEVTKLPQTIISRVQRFNFKRATQEELVKTIEKIAKSEGIKIEEEATAQVAKAADGSFRDAVSIIDQLSTKGRIITQKEVRALILPYGFNHTFDFVESLVERDIKRAIAMIEELAQNGLDISPFTKEVVLFLEKLLFIKIGIEETQSEFGQEQLSKMRTLTSRISANQIQNLMKLYLIAEGEIKLYPLPQIPLILASCKYCLPEDEVHLSSNPPEVKEKEGGVSIKPSSKKPAKSLIAFEKNWSQFLNKVRPVNTNLMAILRSARPVSFDKGNLTLQLFYRFHKEKLEEPKVCQTLEGILEEVMSQPIKLKFALASKETKPPKAISKSDVIDVDVDHFETMSREITEIFSK